MPEILLQLTDLDVDLAWNSRSAANVALFTISETDEESSGLEGLMRNLLVSGQQVPVDVRATTPPFYKVTGKAYSLVAGFRRVTALSALFANPELIKAGGKIVPNLENGSVRAIDHGVLTEKDAFLLNAGENTNRDSLSPPDIFGVVEKAIKHHAMTPGEVALRLGKTDGVVKSYVTLMKLPAYVLTHWRQGGDFEGIKSSKRVSVVDMFDLAKRPRESHIAEYKRHLENQVKKIDSTAWLEKAKHRATAIGTLLARLQKAGLLTIHSRNAWLVHIDLLVRVGKRELRWKDAQALAKMAEDSFNREMGKPLENGDAQTALGIEPDTDDLS